MRFIILILFVIGLASLGFGGPVISNTPETSEQPQKDIKISPVLDSLGSLGARITEAVKNWNDFRQQRATGTEPLPQEIKSKRLRAITPVTDSDKKEEAARKSRALADAQRFAENKRAYDHDKLAKAEAGPLTLQYIASLFKLKTLPVKEEITFRGDIFNLRSGTSGGRIIELPGRRAAPGPILGFSDRYIYFKDSSNSIGQWDLKNANISSISFDGKVAGFQIRGANFLTVIEGVGLVTRDESNRVGEIQPLGGNHFLKDGVAFFSTGLIAIESNPIFKSGSIFKFDFRNGKLYRYDLPPFTGVLTDENIVHILNGDVVTTYDLLENVPRVISSLRMETKGSIISSARRNGTKLEALDKNGEIIVSMPLDDQALPLSMLPQEKCANSMERVSEKLEAYRKDFRDRATKERLDVQQSNFERNPPVPIGNSILGLSD